MKYRDYGSDVINNNSYSVIKNQFHRNWRKCELCLERIVFNTVNLGWMIWHNLVRLNTPKKSLSHSDSGKIWCIPVTSTHKQLMMSHQHKCPLIISPPRGNFITQIRTKKSLHKLNKQRMKPPRILIHLMLWAQVHVQVCVCVWWGEGSHWVTWEVWPGYSWT